MKILVFTKNWLGDILFETPAIKVLKRNFPSAQIVCATAPRCEEILRKNPYVADVIAFDEKTIHRSFGDKMNFVMRLRREKFDKAFLFHRSFTRALLTFLGGVKDRVGYATKARRFLLTQPVLNDSTGKHHIQGFMDLMVKAGLRVDVEPYCEFYFSEEDDRQAARLLSDKGLNLSLLVSLNPGGNRANKRWPPFYFARLADLLMEKYRCSLVITGHSQDDALASEIMHAAKRSKPISLCGNTRLGDLGAVFSRCALVISGDSGPLHIAAGVGANVVGLFGPTDPRLTGPRGRGRNLVIQAEPKNGFSMASLKPEKVFEVIEKEKLL